MGCYGGARSLPSGLRDVENFDRKTLPQQWYQVFTKPGIIKIPGSISVQKTQKVSDIFRTLLLSKKRLKAPHINNSFDSRGMES